MKFESALVHCEREITYSTGGYCTHDGYTVLYAVYGGAYTHVTPLSPHCGRDQRESGRDAGRTEDGGDLS